MQSLICKKIKEQRVKHGYSQQEVADALSMSQNAYSLLENGITKLDVERLLVIADFYKVSAYYLLDIPPPRKKRKTLIEEPGN